MDPRDDSNMPITRVVYGKDHPRHRRGPERKPPREHGTPLARIYPELLELKKRLQREADRKRRRRKK